MATEHRHDHGHRYIMSIDWTIAAAGLAVGFVIGMTGMGGGALMTPILVLVFGIPPLSAVSSDLVASVVIKPIGGGVHIRHGTVDMRLAGWLVAGSVPAAFCSVWLLGHISDPGILDDVISYAIGVALVAASIGLIIKARISRRASDTVGHGDSEDDGRTVVRPLPTIAIGVFGGLMVGVTSVGSGSLMMVLLMLLYPNMKARTLVGTDLVQAVPLVAAAALSHALFGDVRMDVTGSLLIGAIPAVYVGARISTRAPDYVIRPILTLVLGTSGTKMLGLPDVVVVMVGAVLLIRAVCIAIPAFREARRRRIRISNPIPDVGRVEPATAPLPTADPAS